MRQSFPLSALALTLVLGACAEMPDFLQPRPGGTVAAPDGAAPPPPPEEIAGIVAAPRPAAAARTADQFDTTTAEQKAAASAAPTGGERRLGETVASLGDPTEPGLWIKTSLVSESGSGRLEYPASGKSAVVQLIPLPGGGGSQVSLSAMRLLEAPLTDLPTLVVYAN